MKTSLARDRLWNWLWCGALGAASLCAEARSEPEPRFEVEAATAGEKMFALDVKQVLAEKCWSCHGKEADEIKGGLNLLTREGALRGGESSSQVLVPGDASASLLYRAVTWTDPDLEMPPKENDRLTEEQVWKIRDWIDEGAPWLSDASVAALQERHGTGVQVATSGGLSEEWTQRRYDPEDLWAYQPVEMPDVPGEGRNHPDAFIEARLEEMELEPGPMADRRALIRRATYDLTGLPPTPREVEIIVADPDSDERAFEKIIDRLLASHHYGERWARHWLDVVRYADSSGFANDYQRGNAWRYRDYVIRAFNEDKPYDDFVREQIAGDEIDPQNPEMLVAAGMLRMGAWELTGMEVAKIARQRFLDDVTDAVGQVFLSHALQCARCHDHKFDPIPTRDYYGMQAVFATTQLVEREAAFVEGENRSGFEERNYLLKRQDRFRKLLKQLHEKEEAAAREWCEERGLEHISRNEGLKKGLPEEVLPPKKVGFTVEDYGMERIARKGLERLRWELDRYEPVAFSVYSGLSPNRSGVYAPIRLPEEPMKKGVLEETSILAGGDPFSPMEAVSPGVLSAVPVEAKIPKSVAGRRLALAEWVTDPDNPLTTRSIVNRIWQWHFGKGLAGNPNNFGATAKKPTHPELLDWLAGTFVEEGWSFKRMHRLIMSSRAYRRAAAYGDDRAQKEYAARDPDGASYAVFGARRLTAEELRDSALAVSGLLNREVGGIPVRPEMNLETALQPRQVMGTFAPAWQPSPQRAVRHRRSIYALKLRGLADPFMEVFNVPSPETSCEQRDESSVTPQVFALWNSQSSHQQAVAFAERLQAETGSRAEAVGRAYELAFGRRPSERELRVSLEHWERMQQRHERMEVPAPEIPVEVVRHAVEENTGEKFSFVERLDFYEDFEPDKWLDDVSVETRGLAELCLVLLNSNEFIYVY